MLRRFIASLLIVSVAGLGVVVPAQAALLGTDAAVADAEQTRILLLLDRADMRAALEAHGVSPAEVKARVAAMTDEEAAQLAARIDSLPAGGNVLGLVVFVFIVLLITDILGFTKIFPFTKPVR
ncbi:MAG TPA: PA2779 family protein [Burkholderiales bacterium]|nr:PA2779 family protein [Burkholderiales bacterium]